MAQSCQICVHPQSASINKLLLESDQPIRQIAAAFNVSYDQLQRHKLDHIPSQIAKVLESQKLKKSRTLLESLDSIESRIHSTLRRLMPDEEQDETPAMFDPETANLQGIAAILKSTVDILALKGKASGELGETVGAGTQIAIVIPSSLPAGSPASLDRGEVIELHQLSDGSMGAKPEPSPIEYTSGS